MADSSSISTSVYRLINKMSDVIDVKLQPELPEFKAVRNVVKTSDVSIPTVVSELFLFLKCNSPINRHSALLLVDYFFNRSHNFRLNIVERLQELLKYVCETNPLHHPIPPPKSAANSLKIAGIKIVKAWNDKFASGYPKLDFARSFLQESKSVDFDRATAEVQAERLKKEEEDRKIAERQEKAVSSVMKRFGNSKLDMDRCLNEVDSALLILVPPFVEDNERDSPARSHDDNDRLHGCSDSQNVSILIKPEAPLVEVSTENESIVHALRDARVMLESYTTLLTTWLQKLGQSGAKGDNVKLILDYKQKLTSAGAKVDELKIVTLRNPKEAASDDSDDSDMEDVPEKKLEDFEQPYEVPKYIMDSIAAAEAADKPSCSRSAQMEKASSGEATDVPGKTTVPVVPFGLDLKYWGEKRGNVEAPRNNFDGHRFWRPPDEDQVAVVQPSVYETRLITYVGEELRPKRECRARLTSGQLCPRRDQKKCPIHGEIIDRDEEGFPVEETSSTPVAPVTESFLGDDEFMRDLEAATGRNLSGKDSKRKKEAKPVPEGRAVRDRIQKKVMDKRAMKRVGATLDAIQKAKIEKKYASQFVHALHR